MIAMPVTSDKKWIGKLKNLFVAGLTGVVIWMGTTGKNQIDFLNERLDTMVVDSAKLELDLAAAHVHLKDAERTIIRLEFDLERIGPSTLLTDMIS